MSNSPVQIPTPQSQTQQPTAPPSVSDKTIDAFMAVPDKKKREALSKMTEPTKQALLQGIKARKGMSTNQPLKPVEKAMPFSSGVASGMMLDPTAIAKQSTTIGQVKEVGKEMGRGALDLGISILKDPLSIGKPIDAIVKGQESAYKKVHEGLKSGNHDEIMNGLGEAVGNLSMLLGGAKSAREGFGVSSAARDAVFTAKDLTTKRAIVSAASHGVLDSLKDEHKAAIDTAVKAERARIGGNVQAINVKDISADPNGYMPQKLAIATLDQAVSNKKANVLLNKRMLPKVAQVRGLLEGHSQNLTFNDLKQVRTVVGNALENATGVERAILSDYYDSLSKNLKGRSSHLGSLQEWEDYNEGSNKLSEHEKGIIAELTDSKTGLEYAKKIGSEQNGPRLSTLESDLKLPKGFFEKAVKDYKPIINFAKMTEGDSIVAKTANRLIALKQHPISAAMGGTAGVLAGRAVGTAIGSPMAGSFIGLTLGAAFMHDLMSKYDAARAIREIGGPSGVMGFRSGQAPSSSGASGAKPSTGLGGGGSSPSPTQPSGNIPPGSPSPVNTSTLSPALANLLPEMAKDKVKSSTTTEIGGREAKGLEVEKAVSRNIPFQKAQFDAAIDRSKEIIRDSKATSEEKAIAASQLKNYREWAAKLEEPKVTKVAEGQHGRESSARKGMTKDTPEARRAKARERIAAKREEASRTQIKGSLEDQARQVAGRMDFQGKSNIELEEGLQTLYGDNGKRFLKEFKNIAKQMKWSEEVYRGYLEDTIDRRAEELSSKPNIPGLDTKPKKIE